MPRLIASLIALSLAHVGSAQYCDHNSQDYVGGNYLPECEVETGNNSDFWQVDLGYQFLVEHISISLRHPKVNISLDLTMTVDGRYCGQIQKYITGTNSTIACEKGGVNGSLVEVKVSPTIPHKFCKCTLNVCGVLASASKIQLLGQFATQSSTYYVGYEADKAIDGISASCAETNDNLEDDPWWEVDMGGPISVYYVTIYHRVSASLYYVNFNVTVDDQLCGVGLNDQYDFLTIMCEKPVTGNILKIQQMRGASRWYTAWFSLCEVEAWGTRVTKQIKGKIMPQVNLFLLWARQSSTWSEDTIASMAIDGNPNTCTQTYDWVDSKPWWTVDMGAIVTVQAFRITNRQSYESRLGNVFVTVDDQACGPIYKNGDSYYLWVTCEKPVTGQLLKIQLLEAPVRGILTLCEVEVWGYFNATRYIVYPVPEVNLIGLPSRQSSTYAISYEASMGNDGNPSTCTWTAPFISNQPWWQVYMGGNVTIHSVKILNYSGHRDHLGNVVITVDGIQCGPKYTYAAIAYLWVTCPIPVTGTTLMIQLENAPVNGILALCEVQVWGYKQPALN